MADAVAAACSQPQPGSGRARKPKEEDAGDAGDAGATKTRKRRRRAATPTSDSPSRRSDVRDKLLNEGNIDAFPPIGADAQVAYAMFGALRWARERLDIDGLTSSEIAAFLTSQLRRRTVPQSINSALGQHPRAIDSSSGRPAVHRLMASGDDVLDAYLASVQSGATPAQAEAAASEVEGEAENNT